VIFANCSERLAKSIPPNGLHPKHGLLPISVTAPRHWPADSISAALKGKKDTGGTTGAPHSRGDEWHAIVTHAPCLHCLVQFSYADLAVSILVKEIKGPPNDVFLICYLLEHATPAVISVNETVFAMMRTIQQTLCRTSCEDTKRTDVSPETFLLLLLQNSTRLHTRASGISFSCQPLNDRLPAARHVAMFFFYRKQPATTYLSSILHACGKCFLYCKPSCKLCLSRRLHHLRENEKKRVHLQVTRYHV
jgi:hypothetical protein